MAEKSDNKAKMAQKVEDGMMVPYQTGWEPQDERGRGVWLSVLDGGI